jgi:hypothetical protein
LRQCRRVIHAGSAALLSAPFKEKISGSTGADNLPFMLLHLVSTPVGLWLIFTALNYWSGGYQSIAKKANRKAIVLPLTNNLFDYRKSNQCTGNKRETTAGRSGLRTVKKFPYKLIS